LDVTVVLPTALEAVTVHVITFPTSTEEVVYELVIAPVIKTPLLYHCLVYTDGAFPQVPSSIRKIVPTVELPSIIGAFNITGAVDILLINFQPVSAVKIYNPERP
jgi:hypothetical protein